MNVRAATIPLFGLVLILSLPTTAVAQRKLWGVTASYTPIFTTVEFSKYLEGADTASLEGNTFRFGVSRGGTLLGDWSLLVVRRSLKVGGSIERDGHTYTTTDNVRLTGFEAEKFAVKGAFKDRVVLGVIVAVGVAVAQGTMTSETGANIDAKEVLTLLGTDLKLEPMFRLEFGVGVIVARGFRIRASGGFDWPGFSGTVAATYFFGDK